MPPTPMTSLNPGQWEGFAIIRYCFVTLACKLEFVCAIAVRWGQVWTQLDRPGVVIYGLVGLVLPAKCDAAIVVPKCDVRLELDGAIKVRNRPIKFRQS
jgi:hypothetical protein